MPTNKTILFKDGSGKESGKNSATAGFRGKILYIKLEKTENCLKI